MAGPIRNMMSRIRSRRMARRSRRRGGNSQGGRNYIDPMESMAASDGAQSYNIGVDSPPTQIMAGRGDEMMGGTVIDGAVQMPGGMPMVSPETGRMVPMTDGRSVPATDTTSTAPDASDIASGWRPFPGVQTAQYGSGQTFNVPNTQPRCFGPNCQQNAQNSYGLPPGAVILSERTVTSAPQATTQMGTLSPQATTRPMAPGTAAPREQFGSSMPIMRPKGWQPPAGTTTAQPGQPSAPMQASSDLPFQSYPEWFSNEGQSLFGDPARFLSRGAAYAFRDAERLRMQGREAEAIQMRTLGIQHADRYQVFMGAQWQADRESRDPARISVEDQKRALQGLMDKTEVETRALRLQTDPAEQRRVINEALDDWRTPAYLRALNISKLSWPTAVSENVMQTPDWQRHVQMTELMIQGRQFANAVVGQQAAFDSVKKGALRPSGRDGGTVNPQLHLDNPAAWAAISERYLPMYADGKSGTTANERLAYIRQDAQQVFVPQVAAALSEYEAHLQGREPTQGDYEDAYARATMFVDNHVAYIPFYAQSSRQDADAAARLGMQQRRADEDAISRAEAAAAAMRKE